MAFSPLISELLARFLPTTADPAMATNNLERLLAQPGIEPFVPLLHDPAQFEVLLQLLATSQLFADTFVQYPESLEFVLKPAVRNPSTAELVQQLQQEVDANPDDAHVLRTFRRFRQTQILRIGKSDVIRERPLEEITRELSRLADASLSVALHVAMRNVSRRFGTPMAGTAPARLAALAFGKLGGDELNYSSDIDLMFVYDEDGETQGKRILSIPNAEYFGRVITEFLRLLSSHTDRGFAYRIDLRLRPEGKAGPLARTLASTRSYYDVMGRTWERQALIKLRPCGGDLELGREFVQMIEPFVYRKYFSFSEINEVKALKRQMEQRANRAGDARGSGNRLDGQGLSERDVKTGHGGIRDIEYTVQFLQLLNGGDLPAVRQPNTLLALESLEIAGCLTGNEVHILSDAYRFLRKTEHRLQLLFDLQTHRLPESEAELRKLALRMGFGERTDSKRRPEPSAEVVALPAQRRSPLDETTTGPLMDTKALLIEPLDLFLNELHEKTNRDREILNHLLHQTFADDRGQSVPESDLILAPNPDERTIHEVLSRHHFRDTAAAYQNLLRLANESVRFLSHRRCRHFLASIAPILLKAVAETPDPDAALNSLEQVTASLGAKAVLYELFSSNPATLKLYVDLCSGSPFLSGLLINNPGMIDELLDSLVLNQSRTAVELQAEVSELLRGATDPDPILHSFQDKELLRIGVADLLSKIPIRETTAALSDLADTMLNAVCDVIEPQLHEKHGHPCEYAIIGLGKLGGREISYHSDLDLLLLYAEDGETNHGTTHQEFFTGFLQKIIQMLSRRGPLGRLFEVDMRLRPTGKSGSLVLPVAEFERYFADAGCQLWERQAMTRARIVRGKSQFAEPVRRVILGTPWKPEWANEIRTMRKKLEVKIGTQNIKRSPGGLADVEFLVQWLQLQHGRDHPTILQPNIWDALTESHREKLISDATFTTLEHGYSFLRSVEARLRIVTDRALVELPEEREDLEKLARRLGFENSERFVAELERVMRGIRHEFQAMR